MKAILITYDSLNRHMLPPYGCNWVIAPNFNRLAGRAVTFDTCFVGSMPCIPARREMHTGRYNFLHRGWGPLEPFDDSMPENLKKQGIYTHLVSDHYHYWEEGGSTYHTRYNSWQFSRGQEGDPWIGDLNDPDRPANVHHGRESDMGRQDWINRKYIREPEDWPQAKTFQMGLRFLETNVSQDNWLLHIETFDPHEPFFSPEKYRKLYQSDFTGPHFDWPLYGRVRDDDSPELIERCRREYAAVVSMCDEHLGTVLDFMDQHHMWDDTLLIVHTDHGFLLSEYGWWGKCAMPFYNQIAQIPMFIHDPRIAGTAGQRRVSLVQTIDLAPTLYDYFNISIPDDVQGKPLVETIACDKPLREAGLFGLHGGHVNCTDGRYVYMRSPVRDDNTPLSEYTHMPMHMRHTFGVEELQDIQLQPPFSFTKGCRTMKIDCPPSDWLKPQQFGSMLFDLSTDPEQVSPISDPEIENRMIGYLTSLMRQTDAPAEQYTRLGLEAFE